MVCSVQNSKWSYRRKSLKFVKKGFIYMAFVGPVTSYPYGLFSNQEIRVTPFTGGSPSALSSTVSVLNVTDPVSSQDTLDDDNAHCCTAQLHCSPSTEPQLPRILCSTSSSVTSSFFLVFLRSHNPFTGSSAVLTVMKDTVRKGEY